MNLERSDLSPVPAAKGGAARAGARRRSRSRGVVSVVSALAVVGFAGALVAPTGVALAAPAPQESPDSAYSLALADTQNLTVTVEGAAIAPVVRGSFEVYVKPKPAPEPTVAAAPRGGSSGGSSGGSLPPYTGGGAPADVDGGKPVSRRATAVCRLHRLAGERLEPERDEQVVGACGLVQALPCSKVPGNGYDPVDNLRWATGYATGRYGSWSGAYNFWINNHWW